MKRKLLTLALLAAIVCEATPALTAPPASPLPAPLPVKVAIKAAKAALAACVAQGLTGAVSIANRDGLIIVLLASDGAGPTGIATSRRKAYSAASLGISTAELLKISTDMHIVPSTVDADLMPLPGGFPIKRHDMVVGAIGVGGMDRGAKSLDSDCAQAGLDAIAHDLD